MKKLFCSIFLFLSLTNLLFAQADSSNSQSHGDNIFLKESVEAVGETTIQEQGAVNQIFSENAQPVKIGPPDKNRDPNSQEQNATIKIEESLVKQLPIQGLSNILSSELFKELYDKGLDGPVALHKITMQQVEPAVAAGAQGAEVSTALALQNIYSSQLLLNSNYVINPKLYGRNFENFQGCLFRETKENASNGSWLKAVQLCSGDNPEDVPAMDATKTAPNDIADARDHLSNTKVDDKSRSSTTEISVAKAIFVNANEDTQNSSTRSTYQRSASVYNPINDLIREALKNGQLLSGFRKLLGDIVIETNPVPVKGSTANPIQTITYKLKPQSDFGGKNVDEQIADLVKDRTDDLYKILSAYCNAQVDISNNGGDSPDPTVSTDLWFADKALKDLATEIRRVSLETVPFNSLTMEALYGVFTEATTDNSVDNQSSSRSNCNKLSRSQAEILLKNRVSDKIDEFYRAVDGYAKFVASGQMVQTWIDVELRCEEKAMSFTELAGEISDACYHLLKQASGTEDRVSLRTRNNIAFREFRKKLYAYRAQQSGRSAQMFATAARARESSGEHGQ